MSTPFETAYAAGREVGASKAEGAELLALYCKDTLPLVAGAVAPSLVWEGAVAKGLTLRELAALDPIAVSDLQW